MGRYGLVFVFLWAFYAIAWSTHNRAGEITIRQIGDLTIEVTVTTYTKTTSTQADRDSVRVFWGDGSSEFVYRANGDGFPLPNNRKLNYYIATHTYPGRASYTISMMDPNRNGGILNVNPPNSEGVPFYIEATYTFLNPQFQGYNNTARLLQPPIDYACVGKRFVHNPNAYDPDGDSLSFTFIVPLQDSAMNVPNYIFPQQIEPGPDNQLTLDPITGDLAWVTPRIAGEYNIAFRINEFRNGVLISSFIRDMQILVLNCDNSPPVIESIEEICVQAGQIIDIPITVTEEDLDQLVALSAAGGPFEVSGNQAMLFQTTPDFQQPPFEARFFWQPSCEQIRDQPYTVIIKAVDNDLDTTGLVDLHSIRIRVVGPPPEGLVIEREENAFDLYWDLPYSCDMTADEYFRGFSVWKRSGSNQFEPDSCETGLEGRGYTRIVANWKQTRDGRYYYRDTDVDEEATYCYRIMAEFARTTPSGQPYLRVVSIPSDEACLRARADRPLLTRVSVFETDNNNGSIEVKWIPPDPAVLDTSMFPGPYRYQLTTAAGIQGTSFTDVPGASFSSPTFFELTDSAFVIENIDTRTTGHRYKLDFYTGSGTTPYGSAQPASSIFLTALPSDEASILSWAYDTPWDNFLFEIFRGIPGEPLEKIGESTSNGFNDNQQLVNGQEYCYYVRAFGDYGLDGVPMPLVNLSQVACVIPEDNVAPCTPEVIVANICDLPGPGVPNDPFANRITWQITCPDSDIDYFILYYTENPGGDFVEIARPDGTARSFDHKPGDRIAGCYTLAAVDEQGNVSELARPFCVQNCPVFELPNAFTPNGDGHNDFFTPTKFRFIERVRFQVFNRWGQLVFETEDPMINWDGMNHSGKSVSDGVYFYSCEAYESQGLTSINLSGYIELIRG